MPKAGSDIGRSCHTALSNGIIGIETYLCSDRRAALLDEKVRARAPTSGALEVYPELSDTANQPRIDDTGKR